jgi:hypothetical protein
MSITFMFALTAISASRAVASAELDDAEARLARARDSYYRGIGTKDSGTLYKETLGAARAHMDATLENELQKTLQRNNVTVITDGPPHVPVVRGKYRMDGKRKLADVDSSGNSLRPVNGSGGTTPSNIDSYRKEDVIDGKQFKKHLMFPGKSGKGDESRNQQPGTTAPLDPTPTPEPGKKTSSR